jgi:hypothetical protein
MRERQSRYLIIRTFHAVGVDRERERDLERIEADLFQGKLTTERPRLMSCSTAYLDTINTATPSPATIYALTMN